MSGAFVQNLQQPHTKEAQTQCFNVSHNSS